MMRNSFLPFALPDLDSSELEEIREALDSGWVTTGPKVKRFEAEFAETVGAKHAFAVNSCTAAMHLALEAIGLKAGDEVITTPYTFAATAEVIRYFDARPVFVDVDSLNLNLNLNLLASAITPRTRAIIPVHIAGLPAAMPGIHEIAERHGLAVIEDAAHADPMLFRSWSADGGPRTEDRGLMSSAVCFSFYATKTITTGEGGMICTNDDAIAERCRIMALHGISKDAWKRYTAEGSWYYEIIAPGYKYNMTDVAAAMGLAQLRKAPRMLERRREIAEAYNKAFGGNSKLQIPNSNPAHGWHLFMLRLNLEDGGDGSGGKSEVGNQRSEVRSQKSDVRDQKSEVRDQKSEGEKPALSTMNDQLSTIPSTHSPAHLRISRAQFIEELKARNIGTSVHFIPLHIHPYYRDTYGYKPEDFPVAYHEYLREVSLPIYSKMTDEDVKDVINAVLDVIAEYSA